MTARRRWQRWQATAPTILAALRIVVSATILASPEPAIARIVAGRAATLRFAPEGLGWLVPLVAPRPIAIATILLRVSALFALLGIATRGSLAVLGLCFFYVFGASQLTGTVTHDMHLLWFVVLLALAPGSAALSLDVFLRGRKIDGGGSSADALVLRTARTWLGLVYFFPGLHKLLATGGSWVTSDNLRNQLWFKWFEAGGVVPALRIDHFSGLLHALAAGVVLFELAMPLLVQHRRTRPVALVGMLGFHLGAGYWLDVLFPSLLVCAVLLLPDDAARSRSGAEEVRGRVFLARATVAGLGTLAIVVQGLRGQMQSYPFACYPTFASLAPDEIVDLAVDRGTTTYRLPRLRRQDEWGQVWRLAGLYGQPLDDRALDVFAETLAGHAPGELRVVRETYDVRPEAYGSSPLRRVPIHTRADHH